MIVPDPGLGPPDLSGNLAMGDRRPCSPNSTALDEQRARGPGKRTSLLVQARVLAAGKRAASKPNRPAPRRLVETLLDVEAEARLIVIGKRGEHADFAKGHLGSNLERVVRAVHRPVLVAAREFAPDERFLVAFDGSDTTRPASRWCAPVPCCAASNATC